MSLKSIVLAALRPSPPPSVYRRADGSAWLTVKAEAEAEAAEMVIEGAIGESWWDGSGTTSKQFREALNAIPKSKNVKVRINSEGGAVGDALAIHNLIKERKNADTHIDGYALSSASIIAVAGRHVSAPKSSIMMIHNPWSSTTGDEEEHRKAAEMLKTHGDAMAKIYAEASGKTVDQCKALMEAETWMDGEDAHEHGFTDELYEDSDDEKTATAAKIATLDVSKFQNVPGLILAMIKNASTVPVQISSGLEPVGPAGAAVGTAVTQNMNAPNTAPSPAPVAAPPATTTDPALVTVNRAEFDAMKADLAAQKKARVEGKIDQLIRDQKIENSERQEEIKLCLADEKRLETLEKREPRVNAGPPVGIDPGFRIDGGTNFLDRIRAMRSTVPHNLGGIDAASAALRYQERLSHWSDMYQAALAMDRRSSLRPGMPSSNPNVRFTQLPVATTSYSTSLIVDQLADGAITQLVNTLAPLRVFVRDFAPSPFMPLSTVQVRLVTAGGGQTVTGKPTGTDTATAIDYESGDHTVTNIPITMYEYSQAFFCESQELMSGLRIEFLANHALMTLGSSLVSAPLTLINDKTFSAGEAGGSMTAHWGQWTWNALSQSTNDMAVLRAQLGKSPIKNAILDPVLFSKLITIPVANQMAVGMPLASANSMRNIMGWNEIAETSAWGTGQGAGGSTASYPQPVIGFGCNPQAIAVAARLPLLPPEGVPGNTVTMAQVEIPGLDMSVAIFSWFSVRYRTLWNSYGIVFGCHTGDTTAGCAVLSLGQ